MTRLIKSFCRVNHLIFVESGSDNGEEVYWFKRLDGERFCVRAQDIESQLNPRP